MQTRNNCKERPPLFQLSWHFKSPIIPKAKAISQWPQQCISSYPNVKLFIHCRGAKSKNPTLNQWRRETFLFLANLNNKEFKTIL